MKQKKSWFMRYRVLVIALALIALMTVSVSAYFIRNSGEVKNVFTPAVSVTPEIIETFDDNLVKKDVYFNVGKTGYPVYVRAAIVVTWQKKGDNGENIVYFIKPVEGEDYELDLNTAKWKEGTNDNYYYYNEIVASDSKTQNLINTCKQIRQNGDIPEGYTLNVDILVQTVQAIGRTDGDGEDPETMIPAYEDAWNLS